MSTDSSSDRLIDDIIVDYLDRKKNNETPSIEEYCATHPQLADEIRALLRTVDLAEADLPPEQNDRPEALVSNALQLKQLGDYRIIREIGRGGMGVVYEAGHEGLGRRTALKVLPRQLSNDPRALERFKREGRAIGRMHHSNIVPLFEVGEDQGQFFLAMQLISGESLDSLIHRLAKTGSAPKVSDLFNTTDVEFAASISSRGLSSSEDLLEVGRQASRSESRTGRDRYCLMIARIGAQSADALSYAHQRGVIHRDVKPSNLILDQNGVAWLTDFGLAKTDDDQLTQTGSFVGTLRYMAPERLKGDCDELSDIYSLGLTLYELLVLRPAFDSSDRVSTISKINNEEPTRLRSINQRIPRDLETVICKAIDKEPKSRYGTAAAFAEDLYRFVNDLPIKARRVSVVEQAVRWARGNRGLAASLVFIFALLMVGVIVGPYIAYQQSLLRKKAQDFATETLEAKQLAEDRGEQLTESLYFSEIKLSGQMIGKAAGHNKVKPFLDKWKGNAVAQRNRGWEWYLINASSSSEATYVEQSGDCFCLEWNHRGNLVAVGDGNQIKIVKGDSGEPDGDPLIGHDGIVQCVIWLPEDEVILSADLGGTVRFWDVKSRGESRPPLQFQKPVYGLAATLKGDRLAVAVDGKGIFVADRFDEGKQPMKLPDSPTMSRYLSWSPDGSFLASGVWFQNQVSIYDFENQKVDREIQSATCVIWKNGHFVDKTLHATSAGQIDLFDVASGLKIQSFPGHSQWAGTIRLLSDYSAFASGGFDRKIHIWDLETGRLRRTYSGHDEAISAISINPDGTRAASSNRYSAHIWNTESRLRISMDNSADLESKASVSQLVVTDLKWHPKKNLLAASSYDGFARVWDIESRTVKHRIPAISRSLDWWPNDNSLAIACKDSTLLVDLQNEDEPVRLANDRNSFTLDANRQSGQLALATSEQGIGKIRILETPSNKLIREWDGGVNCVAWRPGHQDTVAFLVAWDIKVLAGEELICEFTGHQKNILDIDFSPDGSRIASASMDSTVRIWDLESDKVVVLESHSNPVNRVAWHPDGTRLASACSDGTVRIWETSTWQETMLRNGSGASVTSLAWSPDGFRLATGDQAGEIIVWDATRGYEMESN